MKTTCSSCIGATGHGCGGTPHSCGSEPAPFNVLPDESGVPAETMRPGFLQYQGVPSCMATFSKVTLNRGIGRLIPVRMEAICLPT
jgi:hypothetical protein